MGKVVFKIYKDHDTGLYGVKWVTGQDKNGRNIYKTYPAKHPTSRGALVEANSMYFSSIGM